MNDRSRSSVRRRTPFPRIARSGTLLRIYEGCGRAYLGDVEGANIVKIHRRPGKLSYLVYPEVDNVPRPALLRSISVNLRTRQIDGTSYTRAKRLAERGFSLKGHRLVRSKGQPNGGTLLTLCKNMWLTESDLSDDRPPD